MSSWERTKCYQISFDIGDSIDMFGEITKEELREYIDLIFKAEGVNYKNELQMKEKIYNIVLSKKHLYVLNLKTDELKTYRQQKDICKDIDISKGSLSTYLKNGLVFKNTYLFMTVNKIRA